MTNFRKPSRRKKVIHNPHTGISYELRQRSTSAGRKGTIKGKYTPKPRKKKSLFDRLFG